MTISKSIEAHPFAKLIFAVREPVERFVSGFNSRLRKGQPRIFSEWSSQEAIAFKRFPTANDLGEALLSTDGSIREAASVAMQSIVHARLDYRHYLGNVDILNANRNKIRYIVHQPELSSDIENVKFILGIDPNISLPSDDTNAHRTPPNMNTFLNDKAKKALQNWYAEDVEMYQWCLEHRRNCQTNLTSGN